MPSFRSALLVSVVGLVASSCSPAEDAPREWATVSTGTLVGNGVTQPLVDAEGNFVGLESSLGVVASGSDPTLPWQPVRAVNGAVSFGSTAATFPPIAIGGGRVYQSTTEGWVDRGPSSASGTGFDYSTVVGADESGKLVVMGSNGAIARMAAGAPEILFDATGSRSLGDLFVSPKGDVFTRDPSTSASEIYSLANGSKTAILLGRGCPDNSPETCTRAVVVLGFDRAGAFYVATLAKRTSETYFSTRVWELHKYESGAWTALPSSPPMLLNGYFSCGVSPNGTIYCQRTSPQPIEPEDDEQRTTLIRLNAGGTEWVDLGDLPQIEGEQQVFRVVARDDGRVALTCCALGNGNDGLWVSK